MVRNMANETSLFSFDPGSYCYSGSIGIAPVEDLAFSVDSLRFSEPCVFSIPHRRISDGPALLQFRDASGHSVLSGEELDAGEDILIAWSSVAAPAVYKIMIRIAAETSCRITAEATEVILPAGILEAGSACYLRLDFQRIFGDPLFKAADYYSVATREGVNRVFSLSP